MMRFLNASSWVVSERERMCCFQVVSSFLEDKYVEDDSRNCGVFKVNRTVFPAHCNDKREWICKIPKGKMLINMHCLLHTLLAIQERQGKKLPKSLLF